MPSRLSPAFVRRSWWWVFALLIAMPAVALAVLGLGVIRADDRDRERRHRERQSDVADQIRRLADASLATTLERLVADAGPLTTAADASIAFAIEANGTVSFPAHRVTVLPFGSAPRLAPLPLPYATRVVTERALAAEARGRKSEASLLYDTVRVHPRLRPWAEWRMRMVSNPTPAVIAAHLADAALWASDARTPSGIPLAIATASEIGEESTVDRALRTSLARRALESLRAGRWRVSLDQRRAYDLELGRLASGSHRTDALVVEPHLDRLARVASLARTSFDDSHRLPPRAALAGDGVGDFVLVWSPPGQPPDSRSGVAVPGHAARERMGAAIAALLEGQPFHAVLRHDDVPFWAGGDPSGARVVDAAGALLASTPGWTLALIDTSAPPLDAHGLLTYARVILPILVLACGLVMTSWIMRRELALARLQSTFVAAVTHEFKSPITSIRLLMERFASGRIPPGEPAARYHAAIGAETDRLENLVNRLLEAQKLQSGQKTYTLQPSPLEPIVADAIERMRPQADAKQIYLASQVAGLIPPMAIDADAMSDAVRNLIDNAIKYSPDRTEVQVTLDVEGRDVRLTVSDQGIGVDPAEAHRVFEPFYRSRRGDHANVHGTGLGLSLVRATAEAHGGRVTVGSNGTRGSRFELRLPIPPFHHAPRGQA
jgi:signal transduction histidine kinase